MCVCPVSQAVALCAVNVAFNKEAKVSSVVATFSGACTPVDGRTDFESGTCLWTKELDKSPYWTLDLGSVYTIQGFNITWHPYQCKRFSIFDGVVESVYYVEKDNERTSSK